MSFPTKDTTFGTIIYKNNKYDLLTNPLSKNEYQKINKYKKENNCMVIMSPTGGNIFEWLIDDDKLYLISAKFRQHINYTINVIDEIFHTKKLFASWWNDKIKLIISKKELGRDEQKKMIIEREILIMDFKNGILVNSTKEIEQYSSSSLKYYIDEE
jgi:hydroxymethylpyrimidine pyrophosphatase-like HAD family hydrolase